MLVTKFVPDFCTGLITNVFKVQQNSLHVHRVLYCLCIAKQQKVTEKISKVQDPKIASNGHHVVANLALLSVVCRWIR